MSLHLNTLESSVASEIQKSITKAIEDARVEVTGSGGHYSIVVISQAFANRSMLESQRLVYSAIAHLMAGNNAPVHAVDKLTTKTPQNKSP